MTGYNVGLSQMFSDRDVKVGVYDRDLDWLRDFFLLKGVMRNGDGVSSKKPSVLSPRVNISETENGYIVTAELPGMEEDGLKVQLNRGVLEISGEKSTEKEEEGKVFHCVERSYGVFKRSIKLPDDADENKVSAVYTKGVLNVTVEKHTGSRQKIINVEVRDS